VFAEYAKNSPDEMLLCIGAIDRGTAAAALRCGSC
jgi:hypothetical protein